MAVKHLIGSGLLTNDNDTPLSGQISLYENRLTEFTLEKSVEERTVRGVVDGTALIQDLDSYITSESFTLTTTTESIDSQLLSLMYGETWEQTSSYDGVGFFRSSVPASGSYLITNPNLAGLNASEVQVTIVNGGAWGRPRQLTVATSPTVAAADNVILDNSANTLTFHSSNAGATVKVAYQETYSNKYTLGVESSYGALDNLKFVGLAQFTDGRAGTDNQVLIVVPRLTPAGGWSLTIGGESSIELQFKCSVSGANRSVVHFLEV